MRSVARIAATFARARWGYRFATRDQLLSWQQQRVNRFLGTHLGEAKFYGEYAGAHLRDLPIVDKALLNFSLKLNNHPLKITQDDIDDLKTYGFDDQQILEAVMCVGLAKWANYIGFGLGTVPDYEVRLDLEKSKAVAL